MENPNTQQKYTCPMHPQIMEDKPGNCPICGMTLVLGKRAENTPVDSHHQHDHNLSMGLEGHNHHSMMIDDFRKLFYMVFVRTTTTCKT